MTMTTREVEDPIDRLVRLLRKLPGVGERTALRLAVHLVQAPAGQPEDLAHAILEIRGSLRECLRCRNISRSDLCPVCSDGKRDLALLCIVGSVQDLLAIERSGSFRGRYYVLGGYIAPLDGHGPEDIDTGRIIRLAVEDGAQEIILATNPTVEGDATANFLAAALKETGARITRIATGIQHGGEIEYADPVSLTRSLAGRREY